MASNSDYVRFPRGQISVGGDLLQVVDGEARVANNAKNKWTLRSNGQPVGATMGNEEATGSFRCIVPEDDRERDWPTIVSGMQSRNFYYKSPVITDTFQGVVTEAVIRFTDGDGIEISVSWIGKRIQS